MYSVLLESAILKYENIDLYLGKQSGLCLETLSPVVLNCLNLLKELESINSDNFKSLVEFVNQLLHVNDYNNLSLLLDLAYDRKYLDFCNLFYSPLHNKSFNTSLIPSVSSISVNLLNNMVFVVDDKKSFINSIRERGYNVNEGPQQ